MKTAGAVRGVALAFGVMVTVGASSAQAGNWLAKANAWRKDV